MLLKIIIHNELSVDGCITGFDHNLEKFYEIAGRYEVDAVLVGSNTVKSGIEMFMDKIPEETKKDFLKPEILSNDDRPFWIIPDSRGILKGLLHTIRRTDYCKEIIVLISEKTPKKYIDYLKKRNYTLYKFGNDHVNLKSALSYLSDKYKIKKIRSDSGGILNGILIEQGLANELSLFVSPFLVGKNNIHLFGNLNLKNNNIKLELVKNEIIDQDYLLLVYKIKK
jgi:2,5-diamino-6-(ribosylamino)-4(3H)-pyrimidinone 5'-phosphate reductase